MPWTGRAQVGMERQELPGRLAGLSLPRQVLALALWPFLEQLLAFLVGTVDLALGGRLEPNELRLWALDAISIAGYIGWLMNMLQSAVGVGATALIARAVGGRHKRLAHAAVGQAMILAVVGGAAIGLTIFALADNIAYVFGLEGETRRLCTTYLHIVSLSAPLSAILLVGAASLRGAGDTRSPFYVMFVVNLINIGTSWLLVFGPAPIGGHGVAGIAGGTAVAWFFGAVIMAALLLFGRAGIRLHTHRLRPHWHTIRRIVRIGVPNAMESLGMWTINAFVVRIVARLGITGALGAHMIAIRIESVSFLPGFAIGIAAATLTGQYLGLGNPIRARNAAVLCWIVGMAIMSIMGVMFLTVPDVLVRLISKAPEHLALAPILVMIAGPAQPFFATQMVLGQAMRGAGDTRTTMLLSYPSLLVVRFGGAYLLAFGLGLGLAGVWLALVADLVVRGILFAIFFWRGRWMTLEI